MRASFQHFVHRSPLKFFFAIVFLAALSGCASVTEQKRHNAEDIARYTVNDFTAVIASADGERAEREAITANIRAAIALPVGTDPNLQIPGALWNIGFLNDKSLRDQALPMLQAALPSLGEKDSAYQRGILSGAHALYARESAPMLATILDQIKTPREFAMAAYTILRVDDSAAQRMFIRDAMQRVFANHNTVGEKTWQTEPRLRQLDWVLQNDARAALKQRPPLVDLFAHPFNAGVPIVFSVQRKDRQRMGLAIVRAADGRFVRNADGSVFHVAQLANAITNLPGTITNGNTPQGLFTITGSQTATNKWIGPTPYLYSKVPGEGSVAEFLHINERDVSLNANTNANTWTDARYQALLPETWRRYWPFMEAYLAGMAGRDEMLVHGTAVIPDYYRGESVYPGTPSAGCLVAVEVWSKADGRLQQSDQLALIKAFARDGLTNGYLVVVEIDDRLTPVSLTDVMQDILAAEARIKDSNKR
jgi:hypothetical protein